MTTPSPLKMPRDFVGHLRQLAAMRPDDTALIVVDERLGELIETIFTYGAFEQRVCTLAARLERRFAPGERVLILLDNDEHYAVSLFACFYTGVIAVPVFPPQSMRPQHLARLLGIMADARPRGILTLVSMKSHILSAADRFGAVELIAVDEDEAGAMTPWAPREPQAVDIAFLQYTSGSTSAPKGVMVSHGNLMANERAIQEAMHIGSDDRFGVWSPLFHDMGLVGGLLQPFYTGIPCVLTSPRYFLERPVRWLELISRHRVTISGGPDFAYRLCLDRVKEVPEQLDLSSWRVAYTGAEPIRYDTMNAFIARYGRYGFQADAVYPCYGLAEATLFLSGNWNLKAKRFCAEQIARGQATTAVEGTTLVSCGRTASGQEIRIVAPDRGVVLNNGCIGEIWASGPSVTQGYWGQPAATTRTFVEHHGCRWLRTGDLGFIQDDELYVTGRVKDMIIVRGHNLYPQDIERAIESEIEAVRKGRVAAFAVEVDGNEGIGIAAEVSRGMQKLLTSEVLVDALNAAVSDQCGEVPKVVLLLNPGALPKTSSGKLQRSACCQGWRERSLDVYALYEQGGLVFGGTHTQANVPLDEVEKTLAALWREVLKHDGDRHYSSDAHFFGVGGSSLSAVQLAVRISQQWQVPFPARSIFEQPQFNGQVAEIRYVQDQGSSQVGCSIPTLPAERHTMLLPLSHAQQRQWFLWQLDPLGTAYHIQVALRLSGALEVEALRAAVAALAERHESLRTVFRAGAGGEVVQLIQRQASWGLELIDLCAVATDEREARAAENMQALNARPFDLAQEPLVRAALICLAGDVHVFALVMHHIVADGASMQILLDELAICYRAQHAGTLPALPELPIQYADYAVWQHGHADNGRERALAWWRRELDVAAGEHAVLLLPSDHPRQPLARYRASQYAIDLPTDLLVALRTCIETDGATLFMCLLAGFQVLLHRYTGQEDIRVGVPMANRLSAQTQGVVGCFVNTVVLRNLIDHRTNLAQALARAREATLGAQAHQELPFEALVAALQPERSVSHGPLFQVMFNHLREDYRALKGMPGLSVTLEESEPLAAQFELSVEVHERSDGSVSVRLVYAAELFEQETIERLAAHYVTVLHALVQRPSLTVGDIDLLGQEEKLALAAWSCSEELYSGGEIVHRWFEQHAARQPQAIALCFGDHKLSYEELNARANRLAHRLIGLGVKPDTVVGVAMERSIEMVVGLLAILKAGGAYVPIDPDYPHERISYLLHDSAVRLLLTQRHLREQLPERPDLRVLELDALDLAMEPSHNPEVPLHGENLVYLIYTSGSTGRPKGVANRHRSLCNRLAWGQRHQPLGSGDAVLQKTLFTFDISFWEFFWPLSVGACLALAGPGEHRDPVRLVDLIAQHRVTTIHFVPSMLRAFLEHDGVRACVGLKRIICSGEALPADVQRRVFEALPHVALLNLYGPTEAAIEVTYWDCRDESALTVPIGRPIAGLCAHVLDAELSEVPRGVAGELYLGGAGLARGYWKGPGLTAERFVADPLGGEGVRLYRTGDLVRWNTEGQLEYLGRIDHQVKIRGFRIELGEIEAQLLLQPEVREAVVIAQEGPGGARLAGYVSAHAKQSINANELRMRLSALLPEYMVPSAIMILEHLPLNANGKVDRKALPEPALIQRANYEAPQGEIGKILAAIWVEVLGVNQVSATDNFFDLGGHSLQLVRVHRLLEDRLQTGLTIIDLFKYPTIVALMQRLERGPGDTRLSASLDDDTRRATRRRATLAQRRSSMERID